MAAMRTDCGDVSLSNPLTSWENLLHSPRNEIRMIFAVRATTVDPVSPPLCDVQQIS